jgi:hypothetical protein
MYLFGIMQILVLLGIFIWTLDCATSPLIYVRDNYMGSCNIITNDLDGVGLTFSSGTGVGNYSTSYPHSPSINPTSINYKLLISTSYGADYTLTNRTISISV